MSGIGRLRAGLAAAMLGLPASALAQSAQTARPEPFNLFTGPDEVEFQTGELN